MKRQSPAGSRKARSGPKTIVLIPSFNTGAILENVVKEALSVHPDVWLLIDGSTDQSHQPLESIRSQNTGLRITVFPKNEGKGSTLLKGAILAKSQGFSHFISMDADGQHPASHIPSLLNAVQGNPDALIMGQPVFDQSAPKIRLWGRKLTLMMTDIETGFGGLGDTLYGFRAYPIDPFLKAFAATSHARGYDFDPEIAVRLFWDGLRPVQVSIPVRYIDASEGGVSHFHYLRDNIKLTFLHFRLIPEGIYRRTMNTMRGMMPRTPFPKT